MVSYNKFKKIISDTLSAKNKNHVLMISTGMRIVI